MFAGAPKLTTAGSSTTYTTNQTEPKKTEYETALNALLEQLDRVDYQFGILRTHLRLVVSENPTILNTEVEVGGDNNSVELLRNLEFIEARLTTLASRLTYLNEHIVI